MKGNKKNKKSRVALPLLRVGKGDLCGVKSGGGGGAAHMAPRVEVQAIESLGLSVLPPR